jgi:hypothetical protein
VAGSPRRDELVARLMRRIREHTANGKPGPIVEPEVDADAAELDALAVRQVIRDGRPATAVDLEAVQVLARLHLLRYQVLAEGPDRQALESALRLYRIVHLVNPAGVPEQVRPLVTGAGRPVQRAHPAASTGSGPADWSDAAFALLNAWRDNSDRKRLDEAIELWRRASTASGPPLIKRAVHLNALAAALHLRYETYGSADDLEAAITATRESLAAMPSMPAFHQIRLLTLCSLGERLRRLFEISGLRDDLDAATSAGEEAIRNGSASQADRGWCLAQLGLSVRLRFERFGQGDDLDRSIRMGREAADAIPTDDPRRPFALSSLGVALRIRYEVSGASTDLDAAIKAGQAAVSLPSSVAADRAIWLTNLTIALWERAERTGAAADLDAAVDASQEAVRLTPIGHPSQAKRLSNLASALGTRFKYGQRASDLDDAIEALRAAAKITPSGHPSRSLFLANLAQALRDRFSRTPALADLDEAIEVGRAAVAGTSVDDPYRATRLSGLGTSLCAKAEGESDPALVAEAYGLFHEAVEQTTAAVDTRIGAARKWAGLAISVADWPQALTASTAAIELLPILTWHGLDRRDQLHAVSTAVGVAADGAAVALRAGKPEAALTLLEQGRGILLSHAINARSDLSLVAQQAPELARRMRQVRAELDSSTGNALASAGNTVAQVEPPALPLHLAERQRHLAREWDRLVDQARDLPGLRQFLRAPSFVDLQSAAAGGAVVVLNTSRIRCDALLLTERGLDVQPLHRLDVDEVARRATVLINALAAAGRSAASRSHARRSLAETLAWLWDAIVEPVLSALGLREPIEPGREHPRIWWCPTGMLTFLPLHAAGHYELSRGPDKPPDTIHSLLDFAVSSYTPTLRALIDSKNRTASRPCRPLTVALPTTPGLSPLPQAEGEARHLEARVPGGTTLIGPAATRDELLQRLPQHNCLHFAGHGSQDPTNPSASALYCYDHQANGPVTIDDIAGLRLAHADLAFLSACETAVGTTQIPDEAIHIAGALLVAGFAQVVATHWSVGDTQTARAARVFYDELSRPYESGSRLDLTRTATAVHRAVCQLRGRYADPVLWAPYVHIGA